MKALVIGGSNGIGLSIVNQLNNNNNIDKIFIFDISTPAKVFSDKVEYYAFDVTKDNYLFFEQFLDIDILIISAGIGRVAPFEMLTEVEIKKVFEINSLSPIKIIKIFYEKLLNDNLYCAVLSSIAGKIASPLFSVYGASKAALGSFVENINIELIKKNSKNRILDVSPGAIKGTMFNSGYNDLELTTNLSNEIIKKMFLRETLYMPDENGIYKDVLKRYYEDPIEFGLTSYDYKLSRIKIASPIKVGYLSGSFDLFHIGHLNLIKRAKKYCDYLIVGVHKDGSHKNKELTISFEERMEIVRNIKDVDFVVEAYKEDSDAYDAYKYNYLFVGSDYKGTERFIKYEKYFKDKNVKIIYFPYTKGISSTQLRESISNKKQDEEKL